MRKKPSIKAAQHIDGKKRGTVRARRGVLGSWSRLSGGVGVGGSKGEREAERGREGVGATVGSA